MFKRILGFAKATTDPKTKNDPAVKTEAGSASVKPDETATQPPIQKVAEPEKKADPKDPVEIQVLRSALPEAGKFRLVARVLNYKGEGLEEKTVGFIFQGKLTEVKTNASGVCQFPKNTADSINIKPGVEKKITAFVSGISQLTTTSLIRRRRLTGKSKADALKNNQRARRFFAVASIAFSIWLVASILIASFAGLGEPLLSSSHELTAQEQFFNAIPGVAEAGEVDELRQGQWQKTTIFLPLIITLLWTLFSLLYGIISLREEVGEAWRAGMENIVDRHYVKAHDPLFERVMAWSGHLVNAKTPSQGATTGTTESRSKKAGFWNYFTSDILSELIMDILPRIFRAIAGGK